MPFLGQVDDRIRRREDRLGRSIVTIEGNNPGWWSELVVGAECTTVDASGIKYSTSKNSSHDRDEPSSG
jgi:hypothetical protein